MAVNRFDVGLNPIQLGSPVQIPFEEIVMALGTKQKQYDDSKNLLTAMGEKAFQYLQVDEDFAGKAMAEQQALVDSLSQMNQGDLARSSSDIEREVRKFARRFGPAGDIGGMTTAYSKAMQEFEKVEKSDLPSYMKEQYKSKLLSDYGNVMKGSRTDAFGNTVYNRFGDASTPQYVDVFEEARKLAKEVPLEKLAKNSGWYKRGSQWYKDSAYTEEVTESDILGAVTPMLANNPRALDFLNFESQLRTYNYDDSDIEEFNINKLKENVELNEQREEKRTEYLEKLNDPSKFKNNREYQNFINQLLGKPIIDIDGNLGASTERAKNLAIQEVESMLAEEEFEAYDLAGIRSDYVNSSLRRASQAAAQMYAQSNIIRQDQDMKFDPLDLEWAKLGMKEAWDKRAGADLVPTATRQNTFEGSPFEAGVAKVKGNRLILESSKSADAAGMAAAVLAGAGPQLQGAVYMAKLVQTYRSIFDRDEMDITHPDVEHKLNNIKHQFAELGQDFDGLSDKAKLELVAEDIRIKSRASGQTTYTAVPGGKEQKDWEEVWGPAVVKGKGKAVDRYTYPFIVNRTIYAQQGNVGADKVVASDLVEKIQKSGGINYGGMQTDVWSALPYGSEIIKVGAEEFYVEPNETMKTKAQYLANGLARAQYGLNDMNYFEGVQISQGGMLQKVDYRSKYNAADGTFDLEVKTNEGWKLDRKYTAQEIDDVARRDVDRPTTTSTSQTFMYGRTIPNE